MPQVATRQAPVIPGRFRRAYSQFRTAYAHSKTYLKRRFASRDRQVTMQRMEAIVSRRPLLLSIETITLCNARCVFCAYPKVTRDKEIMSMELFEKLCREYSALGGGLIGLNPVIADPLVDPMLMERVRFVRDNFTNLQFQMFTNGIRFAKISDEDLTEILHALRVLNISLGGLNEDDYRKMYGVPKFNDVWSSLMRIHAIIVRDKLSLDVKLHFRTYDKAKLVSDPKYKQLQEMNFDCFDVISSFSDWAGVVKQEDMPEGARVTATDNRHVTTPCATPYIELTVTPNGDVPACGCVNGRLERFVGNTGRQTLTEIWNGAEFADFRGTFAAGQLCEMCKKCNLYNSYEKMFSHPRLKDYDVTRDDYFKTLFS